MTTKLHSVSNQSPHATGDVVFVHGLGGDPFETWGLRDQSSWSAWLSVDRPDLNVWSLGYEISPTAWSGSAMPLADRATNVLAVLDAASLGQRPTCFITHSMGGLLVKQLLRHASTIAKEYRHICTSTRAVVFFSTPHTGSDLADFVSYLKFFLRTTGAVDELKAHEPRLRELNLWYRNNVAELQIQSKVFYETKPTRGVTVVDATSADPGIVGVVPIPVDADHNAICRPTSREDVTYAQTLKLLKDSLRLGSNTSPLSPEVEVSSLRQRLLVTHSPRDLRRLLYEVDRLISRAPDNDDALLLRDDIRQAVEAAERPRAAHYREFPTILYQRRLRLFSWISIIPLVVGLFVVGGLIYKIVSWLFGW